MMIRPTNDQRPTTSDKRPAQQGNPPTAARVPRLAIKEWGPIRRGKLPPPNLGADAGTQQHQHGICLLVWEDGGTLWGVYHPLFSPAFHDMMTDDGHWTPGRVIGRPGEGV